MTDLTIQAFLLNRLRPSEVLTMPFNIAKDVFDEYTKADVEIPAEIATRLLFVLASNWRDSFWDDMSIVAKLQSAVRAGARLSNKHLNKTEKLSVYQALVDQKVDVMRFLQFVYATADTDLQSSILRQAKVMSVVHEEFYPTFHEFSKITRVLSSKGFTGTEIYEFTVNNTLSAEPVKSLLLKSKSLVTPMSKDELEKMIKMIAS